jgi:hypothetical protein
MDLFKYLAQKIGKTGRYEEHNVFTKYHMPKALARKRRKIANASKAKNRGA